MNELKENPETGELDLPDRTRSVLAGADKRGAAEKAPSWFKVQGDGFHFAFELNGQHFQARELEGDEVKAITRRVREIGRESKEIKRENTRLDLKIRRLHDQRETLLEAAKIDFDAVEAIDAQIYECEDAIELLSDRSEPLLEEQANIYEGAVVKSLTRWNLDKELSPAAIGELSMTAKRNIGDILLEKSIAGGDRQNFTFRRK